MFHVFYFADDEEDVNNMEKVMLEYAKMDRELNHYIKAFEETINQVKTYPYLNIIFQKTRMLHLSNTQLERQLFGRYKILKLPVQLLTFLPSFLQGGRVFNFPPPNHSVRNTGSALGGIEGTVVKTPHSQVIPPLCIVEDGSAAVDLRNKLSHWLWLQRTEVLNLLPTAFLPPDLAAACRG